MIFLGDTVVPPGFTPPPHDFSFEGPVVLNFEGATVGTSGLDGLPANALTNGPGSIPYLQALGVRVACLANNHLLDIPGGVEATMAALASAGIHAVGAGAESEEAKRGAQLQDGDREVLLFAFGWETIGCRPAGPVRAGINPLSRSNVLETVRSARLASPDASIVLFMHWNYELELYPQPMHRRLAREAIEAGANAIIGSHSHCVQGIELYRGAPIVYSLGNWMLPHGVLHGGRLRYPPFTHEQLAFEWHPSSGKFLCHRFEYVADTHVVNRRQVVPLAEAAWIDALTPFRDFSDEEYLRWFKRHRRKRRLLPIYVDAREEGLNRVKDRWVALRGQALSLWHATGLKGAPR